MVGLAVVEFDDHGGAPVVAAVKGGDDLVVADLSDRVGWVSPRLVDVGPECVARPVDHRRVAEQQHRDPFRGPLGGPVFVPDPLQVETVVRRVEPAFDDGGGFSFDFAQLAGDAVAVGVDLFAYPEVGIEQVDCQQNQREGQYDGAYQPAQAQTERTQRVGRMVGGAEHGQWAGRTVNGGGKVRRGGS